LKNNSLKNSLKYSTIEGSMWAFMYGMGENYLSAMSVFLGYTAVQISILNSFPHLIGSFLQLYSNSLVVKFKSSKFVVVWLSFIQSTLWILLIFILNYTQNYNFIFLWFMLYFLCNSLINPVWTSWMGYLVPKRIRGNYHGSRNRIISFYVLVSIFIGGFILKIFDNNLTLGFSVLFMIASFGRFLSTYYLRKKDEFQYKKNKVYNKFSYFLKNEITLKFIIFKTSINFSVMFLGPLFAIYILRTLELSNFILSLCTISWWSANVVSSKYWGEYIKLNGNISVLKISTIFLFILPLFWILSYYLKGLILISFILSINLMAGITFSGFSLSTFNLTFELVEKNDVAKYTSLLRLGEGIAIFIGALIAGAIVDSNYINNLFINMNFTSIQFSMLISTLLRFMCFVFFLNYEKKLKLLILR
tara:strand:+ start:412 stop:1665 length:1254 start_codon:yes stop_codon:yes gene_type:complete